MYIESCEAQIADYDSPFDKTLDLKEDTVTLFLRPGHYDVMYKSGTLLIDTGYDKGFEELTKLVYF